MHASVSALATHLAGWHEGRSALRMLVAALVAYASSTLIHLPGPYSAVITTLIVARPHSSGVLRASFERLLATIVGAGIACVATLGRLIHIPELLLIALALLPLALITAHNSAYRTSMIAAMIVLSAPAGGGAPLYIAGIRMLGVSLGAVIGSLVSVTFLASRREIVVAHAAADLVSEFVALLRDAIEPATDPAAIEARRARYKLEARVRQALRELGLLVRDRPDAMPIAGPAGAMVKYTLQMHADIAFLKRELQSDAPLSEPVANSLREFARVFADLAPQVTAVARGNAQPIDIQPLRNSCSEAVRALRDSRASSEGARLLLRRLIEDFAALIRSMDRALRPEHRVGGTAAGERERCRDSGR